MSDESSRSPDWQPVLERMFEELRSESPRAQAYWVQQIAFGPVLFYAVALAVRHQTLSGSELTLLRQLIPLSLSILGPLPDGCAGDPSSFLLLARRQAQVLAWGRRRHLTRLASRLGIKPSALTFKPVPRRFQRLYSLIGWRPEVTSSSGQITTARAESRA
jgi:hypothetical protein